MSKPAFEVDKAGLEKILSRRGKEFAVLELVQNALDEDVQQVSVEVRHLSRGYHLVRVEDDSPEGFADLSHAYTLFAESKKKSDPTLRGRFNLGEKLVLACCRKASISTTTGTIHWEGSHRRHSSRHTSKGSVFEGELRLTKVEAEAAIAAVRRVLIPSLGVRLIVNGEEVPHREVTLSYTQSLPTEISDDEGHLRRTTRKTTVALYEVEGAEEATLYELGIPVCDIPGSYHVNVMQKIPLNMDRDNVTPAYRRRLMAEVLNQAHECLAEEAARAPWAGEALATGNLTEEAVKAVLTARYGEQRVIRDPSDPEGTKLAVSKGYTVIEPGSFTRDQWTAIRDTKAALPAGQVTPSPKPYSPDGDPPMVRPRDTWTPGMFRFEVWATHIVRDVLGVPLSMTVALEVGWSVLATWGRGGHLVLNLGRLGHKFFDGRPSAPQLELLIHEMAHEYAGDHLSAEYHEALCRIGASLARSNCFDDAVSASENLCEQSGITNEKGTIMDQRKRRK